MAEETKNIRLLQVGEIVQDGDEYFDYTEFKWAICGRLAVGTEVTRDNVESGNIYRRKQISAAMMKPGQTFICNNGIEMMKIRDEGDQCKCISYRGDIYTIDGAPQVGEPTDNTIAFLANGVLRAWEGE